MDRCPWKHRPTIQNVCIDAHELPYDGELLVLDFDSVMRNLEVDAH